MENGGSELAAEGTQIYSCAVCGYMSTDFEELRQHLYTTHAPADETSQDGQEMETSSQEALDQEACDSAVLQQLKDTHTATAVPVDRQPQDTSVTDNLPSPAGAAVNTKVYRCGACGMRAGDIDVLKAHMIATHLPNKELAEQTNDNQAADEHQNDESVPTTTSSVVATSKQKKQWCKVFKCGVCGVKADDIQALKLHMLQSHVPETERKAAAEVMKTDTPAISAIKATATPPAQSANANSKKLYRCSVCGETNPNIEELKNHMLAEHLDDETGQSNKVDITFQVAFPKYLLQLLPKHIKPELAFNCYYCSYRANSCQDVYNHLMKCHSKKLEQSQRELPQLHKLPDVRVVEKSAFFSHDLVRKKSKNLLYRKPLSVTRRDAKKVERTFSCTECNIKCTSEVVLEVHKRCHQPDGTLACCFCNKPAPLGNSWFRLFMHLVSLHPKEVPAPYQCDICSKGFAKEWDLTKHQVSHSDVKPYQCEICGDSFKYKINLSQHGIMKHGKGTPEQREKVLNRERARTKGNHKDHMPWLYCDTCSYKNKDRCKLITHMKIHTGVKDLKCKYCDYSTGDSSTLRRHMWRHKDNKPYSCSYCEFGAIQRPQLICHYKTRHGLSTDEAQRLTRHVRHMNNTTLSSASMMAHTSADITSVSANAMVMPAGVVAVTTDEAIQFVEATEELLAAAAASADTNAMEFTTG